MRILVVDDSTTSRRLLRSAIETMAEATEILEAGDGQEALDLLRHDGLEIEAVLIDWNMPRLDGIGFLKQLRGLLPIREVPVLMVTSQADRGHVAEALRWGACDYVVKPFAPEVLRAKLRKVAARLESRRAGDTQILLEAAAAPGVADGRPFLDTLPPDVADAVRAAGAKVARPAGTTLVSPGERIDVLFLLLRGEVELDPSGERVPAGECFAEQAFASGKPAELTARARSAVELLLLSRAAVADLIRLRHQFGAALGRRLRRPPAARADLEGSLEAMPMADLVQVLQICRKTGRLRLTRDAEAGSLYFEGGELRHAELDGDAGETAFFRLMGWTEAAFAFDSGRTSALASVTQPTMTLLMEAMRRLDERRRS